MDKVRFRHSFAFKLSLYIITCIVVTFLSVLVYNYYVCKDIIMNEMKKDVGTLAASALREVSGAFHAAQQITEDISSTLENRKITEKELLGLLEDVVRNNYEIYGCTIAFEPYFFDKKKYYFDPYFYKPNGVLKYDDINNEKEYNYFKWDWYAIPKKMNKGVWSEPYFDKGGANILMVTYSEPFYKTTSGEREFCGVVACDIDLTWLEKLLSDIKIFKTGYVFILSSKGTYIANNNRDHRKLEGNIFSLANSRRDIKLERLGERMTSNKIGFEEYYSYVLEKKCFISYAPLKETGWSIGIVIPKDELFYDLRTVTWKLFAIGLAGYILTLLLVIVLAHKLTMPLRTLAGTTHEIGKGNFNAKLPSIDATDETGVLSRSFQIMQESLIKYIANLQKTTAAKEKIEKELSIAREIQQSLIPHKFPQLKQIDLYATLIPAKEIGGDIYDFFFVDEKHLCFAIGDVSGKGVPAALFMAVTKTLLRAKMSITKDPALVFNAMNEDLHNDNESCMFVTSFLGVLNIETGLLEYCNAGHNPPLLYTARKGFYYFYPKNTNPPLGIMSDMTYTGNKLELLPGDIFFLYTDGITEAMSIDNIQFSEEKLLDVLVKNMHEPVLSIVNNVKTAVDQHVSGAVQSDDIAMLIFKYNG